MHPWNACPTLVTLSGMTKLLRSTRDVHPSNVDDNSVTVLGMFVGAALCHNFGLASSGTAKNAETGELVLGAASQNGKIAVIICIVLLVVIAIAGIKRKKA